MAFNKMGIINRNDLARSYLGMVQEKTKNDICWFYHQRQIEHGIAVMNIEELQEQMRSWRKMAREGKLKIMDYNNITKNVLNQEWHILVVQPYEDGKQLPRNPDPVGLLLMNYMVSGYIYAFKKKENRDDVANYVMKGLAR